MVSMETSSTTLKGKSISSNANVSSLTLTRHTIQSLTKLIIMNQFQNLINDCLIDTKHVESAVILVAKTAAVTAASARFQVLPTQAQIFIDSFKHMTSTRERGFYFQDKAYTCVRADRNSIYCKCGTHGLILVKTALYVIVATYNDSMYPSVCVEAVEKLAVYLKEKGK
ncbi:profilin-4 [Oncorhynchus tshawytscha]|uniref:profilin-4 n=1 Tax=Oncorhynchus tshawytscha TaxID=74940 RepID=UPI000D0A26DE|nr:profilin-4 [Oncorhynchus tshawytscha]